MPAEGRRRTRRPMHTRHLYGKALEKRVLLRFSAHIVRVAAAFDEPES